MEDPMLNWTQVKEAIEGCDKEAVLRELRDTADITLRKVQKENSDKNLDKYKEMYDGKTILVYGRNIGITYSKIRYDDIKIIQIDQVVHVYRDNLTISGKMLHIVYDSVRSMLSNLSAEDLGSVEITHFYDQQIRVSIDEIDHIVTKEEIDGVVGTALNNVKIIGENWSK